MSKKYHQLLDEHYFRGLQSECKSYLEDNQLDMIARSVDVRTGGLLMPMRFILARQFTICYGLIHDACA